jgi:hypothetical protein
MNEIVIDGLVFSGKYFERISEPAEEEIHQRIERVRCGVEPQILIDEALNVLDGLVDLKAATEVPKSNPTFMILPGKTDSEKQSIVQMLHPIMNLIDDSSGARNESSAVLQVSQQECLDFAKGQPKSKRSSASSPRRLLIMARGIKELKRVLLALKKIDVASLANKKMTVHQLERRAREYQARKMADEGPKTATLGSVRLFSGDFRTVDIGVSEGEVGCVFTDPPYDRDSIELYYESAIWAYRYLNEGSLFICYAGTLFLPEIHDALRRAGLLYVWECVTVHNGGHNVSWPTRTICGNKKILIYQKPPKAASWDVFLDTYTDGRQEQDLHPWQQCMSEAEYFIRHLVPAESMIVDPMMGSGTTLVAAINCGMNVVGVEQDPVTFAMAKKRIEDQMAQLEENSRKNEGA